MFRQSTEEYILPQLPSVNDPAKSLYEHLVKPTVPEYVYESGVNDKGEYTKLVSKPTDAETEKYDRYAHIVNTYSQAGNLNLETKKQALLIGQDLLASEGTGSARGGTGPRQVRDF